MKILIRCLGCGEVSGFYKSYKVLIHDRIKNFLTGEVTEKDFQGKICKKCAIQAGYKVGGRKERKEEKPVVN